ncbi:MAG: zinc ribbon domain-containing protein [Gaiellaceae bacterium]
MARRSCANCGTRLGPRSRFCPECGSRVAEAATAVEPLPPAETGPVPVHMLQARPPAFELLREAARKSASVVEGLRARAGFAVGALATQSAARRELVGLRHARAELLGERTDAVRGLGEAVYGDDAQAAESARRRIEELDARIAAKEAEMTSTATRARKRIEQAHLEVRSTVAVETPPMPEPYPPPGEPPGPVIVPEPSPVPSEPPGPVPVPEPSPEPSPPPVPPEPQ